MVFIKNAIKFCPETLDLFPFKDVPNMYQSDLYKNFCTGIMHKIQALVNNLEDLEFHKTNTFPGLT